MTSLIISWTEDSNPPVSFRVSDAVLAAMEARRQSLTANDPASDLPVPKYATLLEYMVAQLAQTAFMPALEVAPTPEVRAAQAAVLAAATALADAQAALSATKVYAVQTALIPLKGAQ